MSMFVITENLSPPNRAQASPTVAAAPVLPASPWYEPAKMAIEFVLALIMLGLSAPLILLAMIFVKLTSPGPTIYSQTRTGRDGKPFTIYKLRSMTHNCENLTGAQWSQPGDGRVTTVGRWLRRTHIDELPQLWNVLRGDMSLIGPRPERPEFLPQLEQAIPLYRERLRIRPGLTGFAQVQLHPDSDLESVRIKLAFDLHYVRNMSFFFDTVIYVATVLKVLGVSHQTIGVLCRFPRTDVVDVDYRKLMEPAAK